MKFLTVFLQVPLPQNYIYVNLFAYIQYENQIPDKVKADREIQVVPYTVELIFVNTPRRRRTIHKPIRLFPSNLDRGRQNTISQFKIKLSKKIQTLVESMNTDIFKVCL